jgi:cytochrome P450 monooxygenase
MASLPLARRGGPPDTLGLPVAPGRLPWIGHLHLFYRDHVGFLRGIRCLGPLVWVNVAPHMWNLIVTDPQGHELLRARTMSVKHYVGLAPQVLGRSILALDGADHRRIRNAMNRPFTPQGLDVTGVCALMREVIEARVQGLLEKGAFTLLTETRQLALDVIFHILGVETDELVEWREHYEDLLLAVLPTRLEWPGLPAWRSRRARQWVMARLQARLDAARKDPNMGGLLADAVSGWDEADEPGSDEILLDSLLFLVLAGHETMASAMGWMGSYLAWHPELWERLVAEARAAGAPPGSPTELGRFPLSEAIFREVLRLHPPLPFVSRTVTEDIDALGTPVPAGVELGFPLVGWSRDPEVYADPDQFRPERWLERTGRLGPLDTIAFSSGSHFCLGYHMAWLEATQFASILALKLSERGLRLRLRGAFPSCAYMALTSPKRSATRMSIVEDSGAALVRQGT